MHASIYLLAQRNSNLPQYMRQPVAHKRPRHPATARPLYRKLPAEFLPLVAIAALMSACVNIPNFHTRPFADIEEMYDRMDDLEAKVFTDRADAGELEYQYEILRSHISVSTLKRLSDDNVRIFFQYANNASFYFLVPGYVGDMETAFHELTRRRLTSKSVRQSLLSAYFQLRMLEKAERFRNLPINNDLPELPVVTPRINHPSPKAMLWTFHDEGRKIVRSDLSMGPDIRLVAIGSPWCHFSTSASADIAGNEALSAVMRRHAIWIMPQGRELDYRDAYHWGQTLPHREFGMIDAQANFPLITSWATPTFYLIREGKVIDSLVGWPGVNQVSALLKMYEQEFGPSH